MRITVNAEVDIDEVWSEITDEDLLEEAAFRKILPQPEEFDLDKVEALDTLRQAADLFRANDKPNLGLSIDNLIESLKL